MSYAVYITESFENEISKLSKFDRLIIKKMFSQLKNNPYVGDSIRYNFFREKRIREKRIYYLIYEELSSVLIVAIGGKKIQQDTINQIIQGLPLFKKYLSNLLKD